MRVGFQLSWIIENGSVAVRCFKEQTFENVTQSYVLFAWAFINSITVLSYHYVFFIHPQFQRIVQLRRLKNEEIQNLEAKKSALL